MGPWRKAALNNPVDQHIAKIEKIRLMHCFSILPWLFSSFQRWPLALACSLLIGLTACGGNASSGPTGSAENVSILEVLNSITSTTAPPVSLPSGTDSISMASFWEAQVLKGFTKTGVLRGYAYQDFKKLTLLTVPTANADDGKSTLFLITHPDHQAQSGDTVTISGVTQDSLNVPFSFFNNSFEVISRDANSYFIKVPYATSKRDIFLLNANLSYKYLECAGTQTVVQTPALTTDPTTYLDGYEVRVAKYTVENSFTGCSPPAAIFTTYKYFAVNNPRPGFVLKYPLLGQRLVGGDFGSTDKTFDLPSTPLKSGDKGTIATMKFYKSSNKVFATGSASLTYEILKHTSSSVFIVISTDSYNDNNNLLSKITEVYGRDPLLDKEYKLIRTTVKYNNPRKNEVIIE
jgi:hypothetical protein